MSDKMKKWLRASGVRALRTVAQTAASLISAGTIGILEVDWLNVASVSLMAGIYSLLTSIAGLPELKE